MNSILKQDLNKLLKRLSRPQIVLWIDSESLCILENQYDQIDFAEIILNQFGKYALSRKIREIYVNTFSLEELKRISGESNISGINQHRNCIEFKVFIKLFKLSDFWCDTEKKDYSNIGKICPKFGVDIFSIGVPHYYQKEIKKHCLNWYLNKSNFERALVSMPTGSGKTRTANELLIDLFRIDKVKKVLWLAHRRELLYQTAKAFETICNQKSDNCISLDFNFDIHSNWFHDENCQIVYSSYDKISENISIENSKIDLIIIDEAHYTMASTYAPKVINLLNSNNCRLLGLTATPMRSEDELFLNLLNYYQYKIGLSEILNTDDSISILQKQKYLAEINYNYLNIPIEEFHQNSRKLNNSIVNLCNRYKNDNENLLIFALSKSHAIALNSILILEGISSACIVGETPFSEREDIMIRFKNKELTAIVNYDILTTGVDIPGMNGILVLRRFNERHTAIQVLGRALRGPKNGGNATNTVTFINELEHQNINDLYNY